MKRWLEAQWWRLPATLGSSALLPLAWLHQAWRTHRKRHIVPVTLPVPVVVVGNVVVGGAGKTPTTIALIEGLRDHGYTPGVISRGHGRRAPARRAAPVQWVLSDHRALDVGDEPLLIHRRSLAPVVVGVDRVAAARHLLSKAPDVDVIVADDGMQHLRLARDAQLIVIDERGVGNGRLLPSGPLREPAESTVPERSVVLYSGASTHRPLAPGWPGHQAERRLMGALSLQQWHARLHAPAQSFAQTWASTGFSDLRRVPLVAAAGMAVPSKFFDMLGQHGLTFEAHALEDHDPWVNTSERLSHWLGTDKHLLVTEKDAIKLAPTLPWASRVWVVPLDFRLPPGCVREVVDLLKHRDISGKA